MTWQSFNGEAESVLRQMEGVSWGSFLFTERGRLAIEIEARVQYLKSLRLEPPKCERGQTYRLVLERYDFALATLKMLFTRSLTMRGNNIPTSVKDDINLMLLMVDRQTEAFALEYNTPPAQVS